MSWYNESRRHSLASKGIKTAIAGKPINKVPINNNSSPTRTIPMRVVMKADSDAGNFWFSKDSMNFFSSHVGGTAYLKKGSDIEGYFVSSEKSPNNPRKYSIRTFDLKTGTVGTEGEFQAYNTEKQAEKAMQDIIATNKEVMEDAYKKVADINQTITDEEVNKKEKISLKKKWVSTSAWRGHEEPVDAFAGYNDTGNWSDSPYPSAEGAEKAKEFRKFLKEKGIPYKTTYGKTSNVFAINHFFVTTPSKVEEAKEATKEFQKKTDSKRIWVN